jgi:hypothetical protein
MSMITVKSVAVMIVNYMISTDELAHFLVAAHYIDYFENSRNKIWEVGHRSIYEKPTGNRSILPSL